MNVNKKLGRLKQWAGERMGGEVKTNVSDDFKYLETEMTLRHEGMDRLQKSMTGYIKSLSKRNEGDDKEKMLPVAYLGSSMVNHGEDFESDSEFGNCLVGMGRTNERIARMQESYVANATSSWLESLERSLVQMKEYQAARKKLESRRLAYDTSLSKMEKAKKEDFRIEEELRAQKAKYEEATEDVYRRMQDIKEAEVESIADLTAFLDAELDYYDRCREVLLQLKRDWPASVDSSSPGARRGPRPRAARSFSQQTVYQEEEPEPAPRPTIRSHRAPSTSSVQDQLQRQLSRNNSPLAKPIFNRASTFEGPTQLHRDDGSRISRITTEPPPLPTNRSLLRPVPHRYNSNDTFADPDDDSASYASGSPEGPSISRSVSPATSHGSTTPSTKKMPPPPPPSRAKKPPPPPPPMKRNGLTTTNNLAYT